MTVLDIGLLLLCALPLGVAGALFVSRSPELFAGFFRPLPPLGWPRGVQEEDGATWNWDPPVDADEDVLATRPVVGRVRARGRDGATPVSR